MSLGLRVPIHLVSSAEDIRIIWLINYSSSLSNSQKCHYKSYERQYDGPKESKNRWGANVSIRVTVNNSYLDDIC